MAKTNNSGTLSYMGQADNSVVINALWCIQTHSKVQRLWYAIHMISMCFVWPGRVNAQVSFTFKTKKMLSVTVRVCRVNVERVMTSG